MNSIGRDPDTDKYLLVRSYEIAIFVGQIQYSTKQTQYLSLCFSKNGAQDKHMHIGALLEMIPGSSGRRDRRTETGRREKHYRRMFGSCLLLRPLVLDLLGLLRSFMTKGEILSMSGPKGVTCLSFLPLGSSMHPLGVCGCSNLGIREGLGQGVRAKRCGLRQGAVRSHLQEAGWSGPGTSCLGGWSNGRA